MALFADRQRFETARRASLEAGLQLIEGEAPNPETARLLTALSFDAWYWGPSGVPELEAAEGWATQAAQMAEQLGQAIPLSAALGALATAYGGRGLFRERVQVSLRRLALSRDPAFGDLRERVDILNQTGSALCSVGEYGQGLPHLEEAERVAAEIQDVDQQTTALRYQAVAWLRLDRWEALLEAYEKTLVLERRYPHFFEQGPVKCFFLGLVASVHALRGDFERAARLRQESQSIMIAAEGPPDRWGRSNRY